MAFTVQSHANSPQKFNIFNLSDEALDANFASIAPRPSRLSRLSRPSRRAKRVHRAARREFASNRVFALTLYVILTHEFANSRLV
ncbi:hypothetical protein P7M41_25990 [Vibrio parahaemolyticus]|nr:hypothetical protein [Vibrio parahaemolyticus]